METLLQSAFLMTLMNTMEGSCSGSPVIPQYFNISSSTESASMPVTEAGHKIHNHKDQKHMKCTENQLAIREQWRWEFK